MNVYCAGAMRGDNRFQRFFERIIDTVRRLPGCVPHSELTLRDSQREPVTDFDIYERDLAWMIQCQCMVAEVSGPSLGVGYEIGYALHVVEIPVLALLHERAGLGSAMIVGNASPLMSLKRYSDLEQLEQHVAKVVSEVRVEWQLPF